MENTIALKWENVSQCFGTVKALSNFNAQVQAGSITALLGPNGAGKTTLVDITMGITPPRTGTASIYGLKPEQAVSQGLVGCMLQSTQLPQELTILQLLAALATSINGNTLTLDELLETVQLTHLTKRKIGKLSGGERQRLRLALALLNNPPLLILDEPTVAMDINARAKFWQLMYGLAEQGRTILFSTHYLDEVQTYAERVLVINRGYLILDDTVSVMRSKAEAHLNFCLQPERQEELFSNINNVIESNNLEIIVDGQRVHITGAGLDSVLKIVTAFPGTSDYQLIPASLDEAFSRLTKEM